MIPYGKHHIDDNDIQAVVNVLKSGALTQGPAVEEFEQTVANYVGAKYAVAVSSGTAALHLAAIAAGVGPGTSLVTSPITFVASANAGLYVGARILFADIDPETVNISPESLKDVLNKNSDVKAIIPVHFAGLPCDMPRIKSLADAAGAVVIEDAAHALGATYPDGKRVGSCANSLMTIFSFHPVKAIAAGEGGMIMTNDETTYRKLIRLRSHGINKLDDPFQVPNQAFTNGELNPWYYEMQELGFHYRITDIQAMLGVSQMRKLDIFMERRRVLAKQYDAAFQNLKNLRPAQVGSKDLSAHHIYVLRIQFEDIGISRSSFMAHLREKGIGSQVHYIPLTMQPFYRKISVDSCGCPVASQYYSEALTIPLYFDLSDGEQQYIIHVVKKLLN